MSFNTEEVLVSPVESEHDLIQANYCVSEAFGRQTKDAIWMIMNPGWDTAEGQLENAHKLINRWKSTTLNKDGRPNTFFLKATVPDPETQNQRRVVGLAIWLQLSHVEGYGDPFTGDMTEILQSVGETERRFASQMFRSLWKRRIEYLRQVSESDRNPPAIFTLDLCAVDPAFQRRGIAAKLVQAGLEEAKNRGNLECTTEGSAMGRGVYTRLGFKDEGVGDIVFEVDDEFRTRDKPPNVFLRTGNISAPGV